MRKAFFASVTALAAGAGLAFGQGPPATTSTDPAAISAVAPPMVDPNVVRVFGGEQLYLQGGQPGSAPQGCQPHYHFGYFGMHQGCGEGTCGGDGQCGQGGCAGGLCGDGQCGGGDNCRSNPYQVHKAAGGPDCFYLDVEGIYYLIQPMAYSAPILTAGPIGSAGRIGEDGVNVLVGGNDVRYSPMPSLRINSGFWLVDRVWGWSGSGWITEQLAEVDNFDGPITGRTVIARPNFNVLTNVPDSILVANPGALGTPNVFGGTAAVYNSIRAGGAELNMMRNFAYYDKFKMTGIAGFRWMSLNEELRVDTQSVFPGIDPNDPSFANINDTIGTRNNFYGGQVGLDTEIRRGRWFSNITAKAAAGFVHEKLNMSGATTQTIAGVTTTVPFGALVLEPNSGSFSKREFAYLPEASVKLGYQWTQRLSTYVGYDFMYLSKVVRPGDQITANVNPTLLPISGVYNPQFPFGAAEPSLKFATNDIILQGIQFGLSYRY